jgi:hypothetical protein
MSRLHTLIVPRGAVRHSWRIEENSALCGDYVRLSVRQSVTLYQRLNILSDFHEIRYRRYLQKVVEQTNDSPTLLKEII